MKKKILIIPLVIVLVTLIGLTNFSDIHSENQSESEKAINYLKSQTQTAWITMALTGAGETGINLEHLKSIPPDQKSPTTYAKYILALAAAGKDPTNFGDENYIDKIKSYYQNDQFGDDNLINDDFWTILALGSVGQENLPMVQKAKDYILANQNPDGGWSYDLSFSSSDTNDTAAAIMALSEAGVSITSPSIQKAFSYLKSVQNDDGGLPYLSGSVSDSCSDAWVISAIYKSGQDPQGSDWIKNGKNILDHLKSLQDGDGGFWWQSEGDNKFCSAFSLAALLGKYYPVATIYNKHHLRIEGQDEAICNIEINGGTPLDLIIEGSPKCGYNYSITEYPGMGLYLAELRGEDSWMYMVNNISPMIGSDNYYLEPEDEVLWYSGQWLEKGWFSTKLELTKTENLVEMQVKYYDSTTNNWQNLEIEGVKVKVNSSELISNNLGKIEISSSGFENGFYKAFVETQIIDEKGYIRSEKVSLKAGEVPSEHQVGLRVEVEKIEVPEEGEQEAISFSINPDILDFGKLKPGESSSRDLTIHNGEKRIYLEAEVSGASVFQENLEINEMFWQFFSTEMAENTVETFSTKLVLPLNYTGDFGQQEGALTFWAIQR